MGIPTHACYLIGVFLEGKQQKVIGIQNKPLIHRKQFPCHQLRGNGSGRSYTLGVRLRSGRLGNAGD